ncbi:MAG: phage tail tape measure protein [Lachnospiraceae bacterium]|nr:phage tail tape measure protein [Lachnospiraceae bacterium]
MANSKDYQLAIKIAGMVDASLGNSCSLTKKQLKEIAKEAANANTKQVSFADAMTKAGPGIDAAWGGLTSTIKATAAAATAAGAALVGIGAASIATGSEFEAAMDSTAATANATAAEYDKLRSAAMEMGRSTSKTATESAQALEYMALAGWSVDDSISGLPGVLRLSEATGLDLARTSDLVTDSMSALNVEVEDLEKYLDLAAMANNKSNQTAEQLMEAYIGVGGTLKSLNVPLSESGAALGVMANRGIKGSEAGNALSAAMINLTTGTGRAGKMMEKIGLSAFDNAGKFKGLKNTLTELNGKIADMTEEERNATLAAIGGKQHVDAMNDLLSGLNTEVQEGVSEWDALAGSLENSSGALEKMASTKLDNLTGDLAIFGSALDDAKIQIYEGLQEPMREAVQFGTEMIYKYAGDVAGAVKKNFPTVKRYVKDAADALEDFAEPLLDTGEWLMDHPDVIAGVLGGIATTITTMKVASVITTTATAIKALSVALASNPVMAAISVAALAGGAIVGLAAKAKVAEAQMKKNSLAKHFGDMNLSMEDLQKTATLIIDNGSLSGVAQTMEEFDKVKSIADDLDSLQGTMKKLNFKASLGLELTGEDAEDYGSAIGSYVQEAIGLAEQKQYAMNMSLNILLAGEDKEEKSGIIQKFNDYYTGLNSELDELGKQLGEAYAEGMKDGVLSMDEVETIQELQTKMANITAKLSSSQFEAQMETIGIKYGGGELDPESYKNLQAEIQAQVEEATSNLDESLTMNISSAKLMLEDGAIDQKEYDDMIASFKENYLEQVGDIEVRAASFQMDTLYKQYGDELKASQDNLTQVIDDSLAQSFSGIENLPHAEVEAQNALLFTLDEAMRQAKTGMEKGDRKAIQELLEQMGPTLEEMEGLKQKYQEAGLEIPAALQEVLNSAETLNMLTGAGGDYWKEIGRVISESDEYTTTYNAVKGKMSDLPNSLDEGFKESAPPIIEGMYAWSNEELQRQFAGGFDVDADVRLSLVPTIQNPGALSSISGVGGTIKKHASGGIMTEPHLGLVAEAGPEAIIPLDGSRNAVSIWEQVGNRLGGSTTNSSQDNSSFQVVYSPVYQVPAGSDESMIRRITAEDYERFVQFMERYRKDEFRLAF